jgi:hypothetical protein
MMPIRFNRTYTIALLALCLVCLNQLWPRVAAQVPLSGNQPANSPLLDSLLHADPRLLPVVRQAADYELQIIYTQINRDAQNQPHFVQHSYRLDARQYFNPASLVKLPTVALSLEKLNSLHVVPLWPLA